MNNFCKYRPLRYNQAEDDDDDDNDDDDDDDLCYNY